MYKYWQLKRDLEETGKGKMQCFGPSMEPRIHSGAIIYFRKQDEYEEGDAVFCIVEGRWWIDAHIVYKKDPERGYLIGDNHGNIDGWAAEEDVFGRAIVAEYSDGTQEII